MVTISLSRQPDTFTRTSLRKRLALVGHKRRIGRQITASAARQMADLLERQSELLAQSGMRRVARDACREVRQLRLLAALDG